MKSLKQNLILTAREAWDDFWEPLVWLTSSDTRHEEPTALETSRRDYQQTLLWSVSVILVPAVLASVFIYFFAGGISQLIDFPTKSILSPSFIVIWGIATVRIIFVLIIQRKRRQQSAEN